MAGRPIVGVIIPAAGAGTRMAGTRAKQLMYVGREPVLLRTLRQFQRHREIDLIVLVVSDEIRRAADSLVRLHDLSKVCDIVRGGKERQDSVRNGLRRLILEHVDIVLVHDAVRPFVSTDLIHRVIAAAKRTGAAIAAVPVKDTITEANRHGCIGTSLNRDRLWSVQTPQGFTAEILRKAVDRAYADGYCGTDESSLVHRMGHAVRIVEGSYDNMKITTPGDLYLARAILQRIR